MVLDEATPTDLFARLPQAHTHMAGLSQQARTAEWPIPKGRPGRAQQHQPFRPFLISTPAEPD